jgi:hypothetical protein
MRGAQLSWFVATSSCAAGVGGQARRRRRGPKGLRAARGAQRATVPGLTGARARLEPASLLRQRNIACSRFNAS